MMVALLLHAFTQGLYASRRIARACEERLDFMAVTGMQRPDFRTISDFRKRHLAALAALFVQILQLCRKAGLVELGHVALDGTKLAANASKHKAMSYGRLRQAEATLATEVEGWLAAAAAADDADDAAHGPDRRGDELPDWLADKQARLARLRAAKAALAAEAKAEPPPPGAEPGPSSGMSDHGRPQRAQDGGPPERAQRNFTDPDSRILKTRDGFIQGYNGQLTAATRPGWSRCSMPPRRRSAASRARSRPMPASVGRTTSPCWRRAASAAISRRAAPPTARPTRAAAGASSPAAGWGRWPPG
jgi:hypothetical protein